MQKKKNDREQQAQHEWFSQINAAGLYFLLHLVRIPGHMLAVWTSWLASFHSFTKTKVVFFFFSSNHDLCTGGSYILRKQLHFLFLPLLLKVRAAHPSRLHAQRSEYWTGTLLGSSAAPDLREHTNKDSLSSFFLKSFSFLLLPFL